MHVMGRIRNEIQEREERNARNGIHFDYFSQMWVSFVGIKMQAPIKREEKKSNEDREIE
jgi:hypothetical protein